MIKYMLFFLVFSFTGNIIAEESNVNMNRNYYSIEFMNNDIEVYMSQDIEEAIALLGDPIEIKTQNWGNTKFISYIYDGFSFSSYQKSQIVQSISISDENILVAKQFRVGINISELLTILDSIKIDTEIHIEHDINRVCYSVSFIRIDIEDYKGLYPYFDFYYNELGIITSISIGSPSL